MNEAAKTNQPPEGVANSPVAHKAPRLFEVVDSSASVGGAVRMHDIIIEGQVEQIKFKYGEKTWLPYAKAMKFQRDGFTVKDDKGIVLQRAPEVQTEDILKIGPDKVIANLTELCADALYARAVSMPGGERFNTKSSKEVLIDFLIANAKSKIKVKAKPDNEGVIADMSDAELDAMGVDVE